MPRARFEPAIPMFERPKTVLALDSAAIETGPAVTTTSKSTAMIPNNLSTYRINLETKILGMAAVIFLYNYYSQFYQPFYKYVK
jgi:hypothetical protein